jgi:AcrR family transcriptional regulator
MQDIFDEAGVSAGGFYRYFSSKNELVADIASSTAGRLEQVVLEAADGATAVGEFAARLINGVAEFDADRRQAAVAVQVWAEASKNKQIRPLVLELVGRVLDRVEDFTGSRETAQVLLATTQGFLLQRSWNPQLDGVAFGSALEQLLSEGAASSRRPARRSPPKARARER